MLPVIIGAVGALIAKDIEETHADNRNECDNFTKVAIAGIVTAGAGLLLNNLFSDKNEISASAKIGDNHIGIHGKK